MSKAAATAPAADASRAALVAAIRAAASTPPTPVDGLPFGRVWVRPFTVGDMQEQAAHRQQAAQAEDAAPANTDVARSLAQCLCDVEGVRLFNPYNPDDLALLGALSWAHASRVLAVANADLEADPKKGSPAEPSS